MSIPRPAGSNGSPNGESDNAPPARRRPRTERSGRAIRHLLGKRDVIIEAMLDQSA